MLHAVIMAGGSGTRFWPASRMNRPKQLLDLSGENTMIQSTVERLRNLVSPDRVLVVTNERLVDPIREQLPELPSASILGEPCKRDTAPCIGVAAAWVAKDDPEAIMVVMPSDHVIKDIPAFQMAITEAKKLVEQDSQRLITFGIRPTYPAESFGYIEREASIGGSERVASYRVKQFREKPNADVAKEYLASGNFYWNSGIFVWKAQTILDQLKQHEPEMFEHIQTIGESVGSSTFNSVFQDEFSKIVGKSIDYAVMENSNDVVTIEAPFDWDDVGSWQALARLRGEDERGNTVAAQHLGIDTEGTIIRGEDDHLIVTLGIKNCLVVHTKDATLVADKTKEEAVREVVKMLDERNLNQFL